MINASGQQLAIWGIWRVSDNVDAGTFFDDCVLFLCQKSKEKKQIGLLRETTLASSCSVILERNIQVFKDEFQRQEKVACQRLKPMLVCLR
jgi:hypothetical protein